MIKKTIEFTDFDGNEKVMDAYFNLTKAESVILSSKKVKGKDFLDGVRLAVEEKDVETLLEVFKEIILLSFGEKSEDGLRFIKNKEKAIEFSQTEAYSDLFMELLTTEEGMNDFVRGILPKVK